MNANPTKLIATGRSDQNRALLDPWSVVHFGVGLAAGLTDIRTDAALGAAVGYEAIEQLAERKELGQEVFKTTRPETLPNALMDVAVFMAGHWLGRRWLRTD